MVSDRPFKYRGCHIVPGHLLPFNPLNRRWGIVSEDGESVAVVSSIRLAKHFIDAVWLASKSPEVNN